LGNRWWTEGYGAWCSSIARPLASTRQSRHTRCAITFATYKTVEGVPTDQIRRWLGHQRLDTTQIYIHLAMKDATKVMDATSL
jgi:integrase